MQPETSNQEDPRTGASDEIHSNKTEEPQAQIPPTPVMPALRNWRKDVKLTMEIGGFCILVAYTVFSCLQWLQIRWTNRLTREALDGSGQALTQTLKKMQEQVNATETANDISGNALIQVQRAFVFPTPIFSDDMDPITHLQRGLVVTMRLDNTGNTPTKGLLTNFVYELSNSVPREVALTKLWNSGVAKNQAPGFIGPKDHSNAGSIDIPWPVVEAVAHKQIHAYIWGWVKYRDVFKGTPPHITRYCYNLKVFLADYSKNGALDKVTVTFEDCPTHNCYDDECKVK